jgi:catechol 2,3-dioxygenase-like lactoylglutathione lyase family enzyme
VGVADVARARRFFERLGWRGQEVEQTVFFQAGGQAVVLWSREKLADDAGIADDQPTDGFGGLALAYNARSAAEVDDILAAAEAAGATITKPAATTFYGGYSGYFADPDGHLWEVAHNPGFTVEDDGSLTLPDFSS